jgi:hypothetical protein
MKSVSIGVWGGAGAEAGGERNMAKYLGPETSR